jgi:hypothetical protein
VQWFLPVIPATQEAAIRRITVRSQPEQIIPKTLSWKKPITKKKRAGRVAQGEGPEFKPKLQKEREREREREGERETLEPPEAGRGKEEFSPRTSEGTQP